MSIFRREPDAPPAATVRQRPAPPRAAERMSKTTLVAAGSKVGGLISGTTEVLIEGELDGEIRVDSRVVVGSQGKVLGNITARSVSISGKLVGNVHGLERVELTNSGGLEGDIAAPRVIIAEGAFFKGKIEMTAEKARPGREQAGPGGV